LAEQWAQKERTWERRPKNNRDTGRAVASEEENVGKEAKEF